MQANCGHWISAGAERSGTYLDAISGRELPVYLCPECASRIRPAPAIETKVPDLKPHIYTKRRR